MNIQEFRQLDARYREEKPNLFRLSRPDRPATEGEILDVERRLGVKLPDKFKAFLMEFGGGDFALEVIYSATPGSQFYLPAKADFAHQVLPGSFVPISDDGAGGYYVLEVRDGLASEEVHYFDSDSGEVQPTEYKDTLAFITRYAYEPA
jgi:hypothetical protein